MARGDRGGTARRRVNAGLSFGGGVARCVAGRAVLRAASLRRTDVREIWPLGEPALGLCDCVTACVSRVSSERATHSRCASKNASNFKKCNLAPRSETPQAPRREARRRLTPPNPRRARDERARGSPRVLCVLAVDELGLERREEHVVELLLADPAPVLGEARQPLPVLKVVRAPEVCLADAVLVLGAGRLVHVERGACAVRAQRSERVARRQVEVGDAVRAGNGQPLVLKGGERLISGDLG